MHQDLEQRWALLEKDSNDHIELLGQQLDLLQSIMLSAPHFVLEKGRGIEQNVNLLADAYLMARTKGVLGYAYYAVSSYDKALPLLHQALDLLEPEKHPLIESEIHGCIALIYISVGNFTKAFDHGYKTRALIQQAGARVQEAWTVHGFGLCYFEMGLIEKALSNFEESLQIFEQEQEPNGIARALTNIGSVYTAQKKYDEALALHEKCLVLFKQTNNKSGQARALNDLGEVYFHLGDLKKARSFLEESLSIRTRSGFKQAQSTTLVLLGNLAQQENQPEQALELYQKALAIAYEVKAKKRAFEIHQLLADMYQQQQAYQEANYHIKAFYEGQHQVFNEQVAIKINSIKADFAVEQAQKDADFARQKNLELQEKNKELERLLHELKMTQSKLLHSEKMASLGELTAGIAHEIKNPLNFVNNFAALSADLIEELKVVFETRKDEPIATILVDVKDHLNDLYFNANKINEHGKRADQIIQSMLKHARGKKDHPQKTDLNRILTEYVKLAYHGMRASNSNFYVHITENYTASLPHIQANPQDLGRVFLNIMNNAFYAMREKTKISNSTYTPELRIQTVLKEGSVEISISDNGTGIPEEIHKDIFNPFFTTKPSGTGTGLGLSLSYEIIHNEHGGELVLARSSQEGSTFIVTLPVSPSIELTLPQK